MGLDLHNLQAGTEFITASGAIEKPVGVTKAKIQFTFARKTSNECRVELVVTVVNTLAYDALLGMDFISAVGGAYDTWTDMFKCRWENTQGEVQSHELSAPCHTNIPRAAYAYFANLISSAEEL